MYYKQWTIEATAANIKNILEMTKTGRACHVIIRNATGAGAALYGGASNVANTPANAGFQIAAGANLEIGPFDADIIDLSAIYLVGTVNAANIAFITAVVR